ncbi:MAG: prepilin-type N-terminal cleavage/methylation domain-containing protein [Burkholderiales bacterium]|jgi:type II secretory pathway pseudopilin PulG
MKRNSRGFTLAELAITTVVVGLLLGSLLLTMSTQLDQRKRNDTQQTLDQARDALIGYVIANGRLPCPARVVIVNNLDTLTGVEQLASGTSATGGPCSAPYYGYYPAVTVGLTNTDSSGYLLDAWGNRIRYAVTQANTSAFTTASQIKAGLSSQTLTPDLQVCSSSTNMTGTGATAACGSGYSLSTGAAAVILSLGANGATGGTSNDEIRNAKTATSYNDRAFIYHTPVPAGSSDEFDDIVTWLSPNVLYNRMVAAGAI